MKTRISRKILEQAIDGLLKAGPFEESFGQQYLRFDRITLEPGKRISFALNNQELFYIDITSMRQQDTLVLNGIEGKMKCSISC